MLKIELKKVSDVEVKNGEFNVCHSDSVDVYASTDGMSAWIGNVSTVEELEGLLDERTLKADIESAVSEIELDNIDAVLKHYDGKYLDYNGEIRSINLRHFADKFEGDSYKSEVEGILDFMELARKEIIVKKDTRDYCIEFGIGVNEGFYEVSCFEANSDNSKNAIKSEHFSHMLQTQIELESENDADLQGIYFIVPKDGSHAENHMIGVEACESCSILDIYETNDTFIISVN